MLKKKKLIVTTMRGDEMLFTNVRMECACIEIKNEREVCVQKI